MSFCVSAESSVVEAEIRRLRRAATSAITAVELSAL